MSKKLQAEFEEAVHDYIHYVNVGENVKASAIWKLIVLLAPEAERLHYELKVPSELQAFKQASQASFEEV